MAAATPPRHLARRNVRWYLGGAVVSGLGSTAMLLVASIWARELTGSDRAAATVGAVLWAPVLATPVLAGVADRFPRQRLLVAGNLLLALMLPALLLVDRGGGVALLVVVVAGYGSAIVVLDAAEGAVLPAAVGPELLASVNGRRLAAQEAAKLVAPGLGAAAFVAVGGGAVAVVDAVTFAAAAMAMARLTVPDDAVAPDASRLLDGLRWLAAPGVVRRLVTRAGPALLAAGVAGAFTWPVVTTGLGRPPAFAGVLAVAQGAGSVVAGVGVGRLQTWLGDAGALVVGGGALGLGLAARASARLAVVLVGTGLVGVGLAVLVVVPLAVGQLRAPPEIAGRAVGAVTWVLLGSHAIGMFAGAALVDRVDHRLALPVLAAAVGASVLHVRR